MSDPNQLSFEQGSPQWGSLRKRALTDLYWFCANVLGYAQRVPMRALFPEVVPLDFTDTTWSASRIVVRRTSGRKEPTVSTIGVGGTVTGLHFDLIVCDDIISREAMENARAGSRQIMEQTNRWIH